MHACRLSRMAIVLWCAGTLVAATWTLDAEPQSAEQAQVQGLQNQVDALDVDLARTNSGDLASQQEAIQHHWSLHMRSMQQMPGLAARACSDWMLVGPDMVYGGAVGSGVRCPMMGHGMGPRSAEWALPGHISPSRYRQQMQGLVQTMHRRMSAIAAEKDSTKRHALLREHYEATYRDMQTMRGMGWMWETAALPDAGARGAKLVSDYCGQCHAPPSPTLHTGKEWSDVTHRMRAHLGDAGTSGADVRMPRAKELDVISDYLGRHARSR